MVMCCSKGYIGIMISIIVISGFCNVYKLFIID